MAVNSSGYSKSVSLLIIFYAFDRLRSIISINRTAIAAQRFQHALNNIYIRAFCVFANPV